MRIPQRIAPTKRDGSSLYTTSAIAWLMCANDARQQLADALRAERRVNMSFAQFSDYICIINEHTERAYQCWKLAGRHAHTFYPYQQQARVIVDGATGREMVSYY